MTFDPAAPAVSARCHCSAVVLQAPALPDAVIHCHCGLCRRLSGAAFTTWVSVRRAAMRLDGADALIAYAATANVTRHFCKVCGVHVYTSDARWPGVAGVPAGIVDGTLPAAPKAHAFCGDQADWHTIGDALPRVQCPESEVR